MSYPAEILLKALQEEQPGAFEQVYNHYYPLSFRKALSIVEDECLAKDLVQDVFLYFWENKTYRQIRTSLSSYLQTMVHNKCNNHFREEQKQRRKYEEYVITVTTPEHAPAEEVIEKVQQAYARLSGHQQLAVKKVHCEDLSYNDAAITMGVNYETLKTHLARGMKKLRNCMQ